MHVLTDCTHTFLLYYFYSSLLHVTVAHMWCTQEKDRRREQKEREGVSTNPWRPCFCICKERTRTLREDAPLSSKTDRRSALERNRTRSLGRCYDVRLLKKSRVCVVLVCRHGSGQCESVGFVSPDLSSSWWSPCKVICSKDSWFEESFKSGAQMLQDFLSFPLVIVILLLNTSTAHIVLTAGLHEEHWERLYVCNTDGIVLNAVGSTCFS